MDIFSNFIQPTDITEIKMGGKLGCSAETHNHIEFIISWCLEKKTLPSCCVVQ